MSNASAILPEPPTALAPGDLAELMKAFNEVTARLQGSHEQLRGEVSRLTRELSEANSQLERSRRLAALGEMAAGIAHEVRNPLGSIRLYARMLEQDLGGRPGEQAIAIKIAGAARIMEGVVSDVLTFAREFRLRSAPIDAADLFDRVLESCCHDGIPGWKAVEIHRAYQTHKPPSFEADPSLLQQALVNIVRNAFEAMAEAPGRTHCITLDCTSTLLAPESPSGGPRPGVCISVRDTGPGVNPEIVARMFNPFFTTRGTGTGLGLSIVHRIIDAHAGRISVRNNADMADLADMANIQSTPPAFQPTQAHGEPDKYGRWPGATVEVLLPASEVEATSHTHGRQSEEALVPAEIT